MFPRSIVLLQLEFCWQYYIISLFLLVKTKWRKQNYLPKVLWKNEKKWIQFFDWNKCRYFSSTVHISICFSHFLLVPFLMSPFSFLSLLQHFYSLQISNIFIVIFFKKNLVIVWPSRCYTVSVYLNSKGNFIVYSVLKVYQVSVTHKIIRYISRFFMMVVLLLN